MAERVRMGVIGCGAISGAYLGMAKNFPLVEMAACADLDLARAQAKAAEFGIPTACSVDDLLKDDSIQIVINLTVPKAHLPVTLAILNAGKHAYCEKPLAISTDEGKQIVAAAKKARLRVGCAPDTFMGAGIQTARKLIDDGAIGKPTAFTAFFLCGGHESWHPDPEFYYQVGGGPMFDMGPYYLTALLNLLGPVKRISGSAILTASERPITHRNREGKPMHKFGKMMKVETPDHVTGLIETESGAAGTIMVSFAARHGTYGQPITIYGSEGTLKVPDPNGFDGQVFLRRNNDSDWREMPHTFVKGYGRSVGAADMAYAIRSGRNHRANLQQAFVVLEMMQGFLDSAKSGRAVSPKMKYERPALMPAHLPFGTLDE